MQTPRRIEQALECALQTGAENGCPPALADAIHYAVFPGGARIRPALCLAVAQTLGDPYPRRTDGVAAAIELLHCASLVHDDLPCFDDAETRRGRPSVHRRFGEALAVLTGDALIVLAFETVARVEAYGPGGVGRLIALVAGAVGVPNGLCAGQAWEREPQPELGHYHRAKTGALFAAACAAGAESAGQGGDCWRQLGVCLGEAYQVADDLKDVSATAAEAGKPVGRDVLLGRPNAVQELGAARATQRLSRLLSEACAAVPDSPGAAALRALVAAEADRLMPARRSSCVA